MATATWSIFQQLLFSIFSFRKTHWRQLKFSENRNKQCNRSKTHKDYVKISLLLANVAILNCFSSVPYHTGMYNYAWVYKPTLLRSVNATLLGYSWSVMRTAARESDLTNTWHKYSETEQQNHSNKTDIQGGKYFLKQRINFSNNNNNNNLILYILKDKLQ